MVPEFIQENLKGKLLAEKALEFLKNPAQTSRMQDEFLKIKSLLGTPGATARAAEAILAALKLASSLHSPVALWRGTALGLSPESKTRARLLI